MIEIIISTVAECKLPSTPMFAIWSTDPRLFAQYEFSLYLPYGLNQNSDVLAIRVVVMWGK